jgi:hypothetical protein
MALKWSEYREITSKIPFTAVFSKHNCDVSKHHKAEIDSFMMDKAAFLLGYSPLFSAKITLHALKHSLPDAENIEH